MRKNTGWFKAVMPLLACVLPAVAQHDQPLLVEAVAPVYPMLAVYSATAGEVTVSVRIDNTGAVISAKVIQGPRLLASSAEDAARKWRFAARSGETEFPVVFVYRILAKGAQDAELATRFRPPNQIEIRRVIPEASTNRDPAPDPPRRRVK